MSSLVTLGFYNVALVSHCAIPSSSPNFRRSLSRNRALPAFFKSATLIAAPESSLKSAPESPSTLIEHGDHEQQRTSTLRSVLSVVVALVMTIGIQGAPSSRDTFEDVPQTLSGGDKGQRIQKPKSAKAEGCTRKCVSTCIRGGAGAPGEGPLNVRRPLVVFKEGFRSRNYCLVECSEICNLIGDGDDGP